MEYTFRSDFITAKATAEFNYEHQIIAYWLENEVADNKLKLTEIIAQLEQLTENNQELELPGQEYSILIEDGEVYVSANATLHAESLPEHLPEYLQSDVDDFEQNQQASCGLEDFLQMLNDWREFLLNYHR
ncbi:YacL family protein [Thalassotalea maritima]|uniref:UPF0231 family protein n=1 Tax=Thalassotalea maritima TaxID=3242416 RepID=UPI003526D761